MRGQAHVAPIVDHTVVEHDLPTDAQVAAAVTALQMLADGTRLRLLWLLHDAEYDVTTLARLTSTSAAATSQHLAKLRLAGLVVVRRAGRHHVYRAHDTHVRELVRAALHHADHRVSGRPDHA
ncbi:MAG: winged helix-turn-helix transcriptional regulator [Candidatus Dormibacteraeota bacterium]|uniref:Winged helix-turn-helix transcriptional regulator n=1 Tax=Candidatus Amunia macphersoniae TaxID=3127014 RepID=A0A934KJR2_9BACT|nr:winged helix-turn-helix transcriptional regulator [Candidatus Dormibacteraeota bacterium]